MNSDEMAIKIDNITNDSDSVFICFFDEADLHAHLSDEECDNDGEGVCGKRLRDALIEKGFDISRG